MDINTKLPQVVSSCSGRFHVFDQARELQAANMLQQLICDYPASYVENFGISADRVKTLYKMAAFRLLWRSVSSYFPSSLYDSINRYFHHCFSMNLAKALPKEMDFFIGLSSFCQEALQACRERDILCAVDHGSLHQKEDALLVRAEAERWQLPVPKDTSPTWIIEKEDLEFNMADYVFVLSTVARDSLVRQGVDAKKIFVNPCGVDLNAFTPSLNKPPQFQIIQVGNISLRKGVPDLINAFAKARLPDAELTFVGSGCNDPDMQKLLKTLSLTRVRFIPPVPQADLTQYYQQASVFVLASIADGFGMVVSQAMACGLPAIVTEQVGARDLVQDGVNGFIVPIRSPEAIAEKLQFLYENRAIAQQMGAAARATVENNYSWQHYGERLQKFIKTQRAL